MYAAPLRSEPAMSETDLDILTWYRLDAEGHPKERRGISARQNYVGATQEALPCRPKVHPHRTSDACRDRERRYVLLGLTKIKSNIRPNTSEPKSDSEERCSAGWLCPSE